MTDRMSARRSLEPPSALQSHEPNGKRESVDPRAEHNYRSNGLGVDASECREPARRNGDRVRIVIADDHPIFRDGLRKLIESQPEMCVTGESSVGEEAVRLARERKPDILLLDLALPSRSGFQVLADLAGLRLSMRTLVLAATVEESTLLEAFYLGAHGIVLKGSPREVLLKSIRSVIAGQYWLDNESVPIVIEALRKSPPSQNGAPNRRDYGLTPQELKIVGRVANGSSNKEVGLEFSIAERTVKHHLTNVFSKLGISGRVELAVFALEHGLVTGSRTQRKVSEDDVSIEGRGNLLATTG
jgi:two-component system, NarL family, nitrate/nitrite response regulator NarL